MSSELWTKVEAALRRPVSMTVRAYIEERTDFGGMVLRRAPGALGDLLAYIGTVERHLEGMPEERGYTRAAVARQRGAQRRVTRAEGYEKSRLQLRTSYLVKRVGKDPLITRFRKEVLGGRCLTQVQATQWLKSPAPRFLSKDAFQALGIPIVRHRSRIVAVRPSAVQDRDWFTAEEHVSLEISWRGGRIAREFGFRWAHRRGASAPKRPQFPVLSEAGTVLRLAGFPDSVFGALQLASQRVAKDTRWPELDCALFVLTDTPPSETGIRYRHLPEWTSCLAEDVIVLTIDAWVSPPSVEAAYRDLQRSALDGRSRAHDRSLEIMRLAVDLMPPGGALPTPDELFHEWNRRFPGKSYRDRWRFRSHYREAGMKLIRPADRLLQKTRVKGGVG